jgi:pilus assembly protein Flp/PilA
MLRISLFLHSLHSLLTQPLRGEERGATAVEYGLLVALIAAVIVAVVAVLGTQIQNAFQTVSNSLSGA